MVKRGDSVINRYDEAGTIIELNGMGAITVRWFDGQRTLEALDLLTETGIARTWRLVLWGEA